MAWYVFAFVDRAPTRAAGRGLRGPVSFRRVPGGLAAVERRADVPPPEFDFLRQHLAVVAALAAHVPAILPVRFGTLVEDDTLDEMLDGRGEDLQEAFALVRERVQFTWRRDTRRRTTPRQAAAGRSASHKTAAAGAGTAFLQRAAIAAHPAPPAAFRRVREKLTPFIAIERFQAAADAVPDTLYHLVDRSRMARYTIAAEAIAACTPAMRFTGPFPPFAFAAELL